MNIKELQLQRSQLIADIKGLQQVLRDSFPSYDAIINPLPLSIYEVQKLLNDDEAILSYLVGEEESFLFVIPKNQPSSLHRLEVSEKWLDAEVVKIRKMMELNNSDSIPPNFDIKVAHGLYQKLFEPIYEQLKQAGVKRVVVVGDGALNSLPLGLLVKSTPSANQVMEYSQADWLIKHFAFSRIPAIHALKLFRGNAINKHQQTAELPFIGFGDPMLSDVNSEQCQIKGVATSLPASAYYSARNGRVNTQSLSKLCQIPNAERELQKLALKLNANDDSVFIQDRATERQIKDLSQSGELAKYRVVAFSTHGLLARETEDMFDGNAEPGLVFTPPISPTDDDDGLLTASEIAQLNFNAEWVVLLACNTATQEGQELSGLSDLSKSFFFAGARSILATHWNINSGTTELMMSDLFDRLSKNEDQPRAIALQQAAISMIDGRTRPELVECGVLCKIGDWLINAMNNIFDFLGLPKIEHQPVIPTTIDTAHPYYWAPFMIIGEGGVLNAK